MILNSLLSFTYTQTYEHYTLSLHDALPIYNGRSPRRSAVVINRHVWHVFKKDGLEILRDRRTLFVNIILPVLRSEEHTSELQSRQYLVCRLLLEKKNQIKRLVHIGAHLVMF